MEKGIKNRNTSAEGVSLAGSVICLLLAAAILVFVTEVAFRGNLTDASAWFWSDLCNTAWNVLLVFTVELLIWFLSANMICSYLTAAFLTALLSLVDLLKTEARGDAVRLSDVAALPEAWNVWGHYQFHLSGAFIFMLVMDILLLLCLLLLAGRRGRLGLSVRLVGFFLCLAALTLTCVKQPASFLSDGVKAVISAEEFYQKNGLLLGFLYTGTKKITEPAGYSSEKMMEVVDRADSISHFAPSGEADEEASAGKDRAAEEQPDLFIVLMESLYDLEKLDGMECNVDPLKDFKQLQESCIHGDMISPVRGGSTCNVEYEMLTGYPLGNTPGVGLVYTGNLIRREQSSLVSLLESQGYQTAAVHANDAGFFRRDEIYEYLGFDEMMFADKMQNLTREGVWYSDESLYWNVMELYQSRDKTKPFFGQVITMELHGGYNYEYAGFGIQPVSAFRTQRQNRSLRTFANLEYGSVKAFLSFLDALSKEERPVIVLAYGDHAPGLDAFGYKTPDSEVKAGVFETLQTTPFLIWKSEEADVLSRSREGTDVSDRDSEGENVLDWGRVSSYKLGARLLRLAGLKLDRYFSFLLSEDVPEGSNQLFRQGEEWVVRSGLDETAVSALDTLWYMQYDRMFGDNFGMTDLTGSSKNETMAETQ